MSNMSGSNDVSTLAGQVFDRAKYEYDLALYGCATGDHASIDRAITVGRILGNTMTEIKDDIDNAKDALKEMEE